jgi:O-methyltransferase
MHPAYRLTINGSILTRANLLLWMREFFRTSNVTKGYALEFGVLNGESMAEIWRCLRDPLEHIYGFDSFEGLPESPISQAAVSGFAPSFAAGNYRSVGLTPVTQFLQGSGIPAGCFTLIPGFFNESLPKYSNAHLLGNNTGQFPLLIHIDCDLYESALPVFDFIQPLVQTGTWLLLDDYWCFRGSPKYGVRKALNEWLQSNPRWGVSDYANYGGYGKAFIIHEL